ncbi:MAG: Gfo/Idh/MocA family oxidoreductase [Candidatus Hodarchaeota archaeon]
MTYNWLVNINSLKFNEKSILLIGAGVMGEQFGHALSRMNITNVTVLSRTEQKTNNLCKKFNFHPLSGGYKKHLASLEKKDLVIIALPIELLLPATIATIEAGQTNILIEKPGSLYSKQLAALTEKVTHQTIRIAYNRIVYPNFYKLKEIAEKEGGIISCRYTFTEWIHTLDFSIYSTETLRRWGIANSLHVINMAHELIGLPKEIFSTQLRGLEWHPSGSVFVGSGISENKILFSYHADWNSAGRWGIEIMTYENAYRLIPLEDLYVCPKGSVKWEKVSFDSAYPNVKQGIAEEISVMLTEEALEKPELISLEKATAYTQLAEKIFGYKS